MSTATIDLDSPSLGSHLTGLVSDGIAHFRGIPYASVTRRWTHSRTLHQLDSPTFDATAFGPRSPVPPRTSVIWSDEPPTGTTLPPADELRCLNHHLAVVPTAADRGAFYFGANSTARQDPENLCRRAEEAGNPVLLVSMNYRLGPLGYAASADLASDAGSAVSWPDLRGCGDDYSSIVGSFGQIDQHNAFRWVEDHIRDFGGDPGRVTAAGVSAGAASIHYHLLGGNPLFDRAILMSGAAGVLGPLAATEHERAWKALLDATGLTDSCEAGTFTSVNTSNSKSTTDAAGRLAALRKLPADVIVAKYPRRIAIGPSADGSLLPKSQSYEHHPEQASLRCKAIVVGDSKHESIIMAPLIKATAAADFQKQVRVFFSPPEVAEGFLVAFGFHDGQSEEAFHDAYGDFISAVMFQHPAFRLADTFSGDSFYYHMDEPSPYRGPTTGLAAHAFCSMLLFLNDVDSYPPATALVARQMADAWTSFASGADPWESFGGSHCFRRFGPRGESSLTDFSSDEQRRYAYQGWLEENYDQTVAFSRGIFSQDWGR